MSPLIMVLFVLGGLSYAGIPVWFILVGRLFLSGGVAGKLAAG
jgi:hypothetical protein